MDVIAGVERWARWTPWTLSNGPGAAEGSAAEPSQPDVGFLPPLLRRRCSRLSRMMLHVAFAACPAEQLGSVPVVFASRYGEAGATLALLRTLARREPVTASAFSHSVHNAPAGLFSIAARNRAAASAVAAGGDTFGAAFLEAVGTMRRGGHARALLVAADEPLPDVLAPFQDEPPVSYAAAVLLGGDELRLAFTAAAGPPAGRSRRPHALQFLDWLDGGAVGSLTVGARMAYSWVRTA